MRQLFPQKPPLGTPINWSHPLAKGLAGFWAFQEGGGDRANDLSGNANHGTFKNMAFPPTTASGWNPGKFGSAPKFDGTDDYVDCGNDSLDSYSEGTISVWINPSALADTQRFFSYSYITNNSNYIYFRITSAGKLYFSYRQVVSHDDVQSDLTVTANKWTHCVVTSNGTEYKMFLNGVECELTAVVGTNSGKWFYDLASATHELDIGRWKRSSGDAYFNGQIDQVRIYNRALPKAEIIDSYLDSFEMFERNNLWDYVTAPPVGAIMNQFQKTNLGADLYNGVLIT